MFPELDIQGTYLTKRLVQIIYIIPKLRIGLGCLLSSKKGSEKSDPRFLTPKVLLDHLRPIRITAARRHHFVSDCENPDHSLCVSLTPWRRNANNTAKVQTALTSGLPFATYSLSTPLSIRLLSRTSTLSSHDNPNTLKIFSSSAFFKYLQHNAT